MQMADFLSSNSLLMMEKAMGFMWTKQAAISDNIANAETPNYKRKVVTFEETFRAHLHHAMRDETPRRAVREAIRETPFTVTEAQESTRMDENGINVTEQSVELVRNAYQLQYVFSAINSDLNALRTVARG